MVGKGEYLQDSQRQHFKVIRRISTNGVQQNPSLLIQMQKITKSRAHMKCTEKNIYNLRFFKVQNDNNCLSL